MMLCVCVPPTDACMLIKHQTDLSCPPPSLSSSHPRSKTPFALQPAAAAAADDRADPTLPPEPNPQAAAAT